MTEKITVESLLCAKPGARAQRIGESYLQSVLTKPLYSWSSVAMTEEQELGGLKQQKCILVQSRRPEVQNQDVSRGVHS